MSGTITIMETNPVHVLWGFAIMAVGLICAGTIDAMASRFRLARVGSRLAMAVLSLIVLAAAAVVVGKMLEAAGSRP